MESSAVSETQARRVGARLVDLAVALVVSTAAVTLFVLAGAGLPVNPKDLAYLVALALVAPVGYAFSQPVLWVLVALFVAGLAAALVPGRRLWRLPALTALLTAWQLCGIWMLNANAIH